MYLCQLDMRLKIKIAIVGLLLGLASCRELPNYFENDNLGNNIVARVGRSKLYQRELSSVVPEGVVGTDSAALVDLYIGRWVTKQLKLKEAEQVFTESEDDIEAMVENYRQGLLIRKIEKYYVDNNIDTAFTNNEILAYYNKHKSDFKIGRTVVKGRIVKFENRYRQAKTLYKLMSSKNQVQQQEFRDTCLKNELLMSDFSESWIDFSEFLRLLPTLRSESYNSALASREVQKMEDREYSYYFQVEAVLKAGDAKPLEFVYSDIRRILFNKRQNEIIKNQEKVIYDKAIEEGQIELY